MRIVAWITAAFGALVVGVAMSSILDELLGRADDLQADRWSREMILRTAITAGVAVVSMGLWIWLWLQYIV